MAASLPHPDPLSITGYYLDKTEPGLTDIHVESIREGKNVSTASAKVLQGGTERVRLIASYTDIDKPSGETFLEEEPPTPLAIEQCQLFLEPKVEAYSRIDLYLPPNFKENRGQAGNKSELIGWVKFKEGGEPDLFSLMFFADALPPVVFNRTGPVGWVPTIELTLHLRAKPKPGVLKFRLKTRYLSKGTLEEDGDIWDSEGNLVALSRQMAKFRLPPNKKK